MKIKRSVGVFAIIAVFLASVSCTEKQELTATEAPNDNVFNVNGVKFEMIKVEGGIFRMGNDGYLFEVVEDEMPSHNVSLSTFYIGETEVSQELWEAVKKNNNLFVPMRTYRHWNWQKQRKRKRRRTIRI